MMKNFVTKIFQQLPYSSRFQQKTPLSHDSTTKPIAKQQSFNEDNQYLNYQDNILTVLDLDSNDFIRLCLYVTVLFSLIGVSMQAPYLESLYHLMLIVIETFVTSLVIVFGIVGFIRWFIRNIVDESYSQERIINALVQSMFLIAPSMTLLSRLLMYLFFSNHLTWMQLLAETLSNTLIAVVILYIVLNYIKHQTVSLEKIHGEYAQKLQEENEQLKARTTPHFFFNMLNTMQSLVEIDPQQTTKLVSSISNLYRTSFANTKEISMLDEINLCQDYLNIEQYRFHERLVVTWQLPDEDVLYDMSITSLMLQTTIEKIVLYVVEMTSDTIYIYIDVRWENDWVNIQCTTNIPANTYQQIVGEIDERLSYTKQIEILRQYYGGESGIASYYDHDKIVTMIYYPLKDIAY